MQTHFRGAQTKSLRGGEAMPDAAQRAAGFDAMLFEHLKQLVLGCAAVEHEGLLQFLGEIELCLEGGVLPVARRAVAVEIEARLTDGDHAAFTAREVA